MAVDFGKNGGFVWNEEGVLKSYDMPRDGASEQDNYAINRLFSRVKPTTLYGENVHPMPAQGVVSVGTFMEGKGTIIGLCIAWQINVELFEPAVWTRWYGIGSRSDFRNRRGEKDLTAWKNHLHDHARQLFPDLNVTKKCADAVLIWNYALNPQRIRKVRNFQ